MISKIGLVWLLCDPRDSDTCLTRVPDTWCDARSGLHILQFPTGLEIFHCLTIFCLKLFYAKYWAACEDGGRRRVQWPGHHGGAQQDREDHLRAGQCQSSWRLWIPGQGQGLTYWQICNIVQWRILLHFYQGRRNVGSELGFIRTCHMTRIENMSTCQKLDQYIFVTDVLQSQNDIYIWRNDIWLSSILNYRPYLRLLSLPLKLIVTFIDNFRLMRPFIVLRTSRGKITRLYIGFLAWRTCWLSPETERPCTTDLTTSLTTGETGSATQVGYKIQLYFVRTFQLGSDAMSIFSSYTLYCTFLLLIEK